MIRSRVLHVPPHGSGSPSIRACPCALLRCSEYGCAKSTFLPRYMKSFAHSIIVVSGLVCRLDISDALRRPRIGGFVPGLVVAFIVGFAGRSYPGQLRHPCMIPSPRSTSFPHLLHPLVRFYVPLLSIYAVTSFIRCAHKIYTVSVRIPSAKARW